MNTPNHQTRKFTGLVFERIRHLPAGGKMGDLPPSLQHKSFVRTGKKKTGGPNLRLLRLEMDKPSLTVTAFIFNKFVHPLEDRYITPREAACLQDFPVDYEFFGTLGEVQQQIGNAIPVNLAKAIASEVAKYFKRKNSDGCKSIASYFVGAGGFDLGFEGFSDSRVSFKTKFSTDIEEAVKSTIQANRPTWNFMKEDIRQLQPNTVMQKLKKKPDVIIGGPPCQPFSIAGKQKGTDDPLGTLYRNFVHHIAALSPEIVIMENVYGLAQVKSGNTLAEIYTAFAEIGYEITHRELLAADYGTPQLRRRLIFVAAKDLHCFQFPQPTHCESENLLGLPVYEGAGNSFAHLPPPIFGKQSSQK
jgi:DNA (cytosine-5)-methyltransferase 1